MMKRFLFGLMLALAFPSVGHAQPAVTDADQLAASAQQASARGDHEEALSLYVRAIARKPNDALILRSAGEEALAMGDNDAAFGFFGRAVQLAPQDARARAGYGRALVYGMRPKDALTLFDQAVRLGISEADIAADRGLARDLLGENRRAQKDYRLGLAAYPGKGPLIERLGLSLAISGERDAATALVRPVAQRTGNGNSWRTLAFIYAVSGDVGSARRIAAANMPADLADSYAPFFARIALLDDKDKAAAVFMGRLPQVRLARRERDVPARVKMPDTRPSDIRSASVGDVAIASTGDRADEPAPAKARKNAREEPKKAERLAVLTMKPDEADARCESLSGKRKTRCEADSRALERRCGGAKPRPTAECKAWLAEREDRKESEPKRKAETKAKAEPKEAEEKTRERVRQSAVRETSPLDACEGLAGSKAVQCKANARALEKRCGGPRPQKTAECDAYAGRYGDAQEPKSEKKGKDAAAKSKSPERYWVQVASGRNRADLPKEWAKLKGKYTLLARRAPHVGAGPGTNRLVIGPFDSATDARDLVNRLTAAGLPSFPWTSRPGEDVSKLATK